MSLSNIVLWIIFGALAGFLAGRIMKSERGFIGNVILGVIGSFVGGWIGSLIGIDAGSNFSIGSLLIAVGGACLVIIVARVISK